MNNAEYNHLHKYQDMKDEQQEKINALAETLRQEYWQDDGVLLEAIKEGLGEDNTYIHLAKKLIKKSDHMGFANLTITLMNKYLQERALVDAENEIN